MTRIWKSPIYINALQNYKKHNTFSFSIVLLNFIEVGEEKFAMKDRRRIIHGPMILTKDLKKALSLS